MEKKFISTFFGNLLTLFDELIYYYSIFSYNGPQF